MSPAPPLVIPGEADGVLAEVPPLWSQRITVFGSLCLDTICTCRRAALFFRERILSLHVGHDFHPGI
jgi:hypothetical protein